ncbi:MAG TPA: Crp/Fnr family transcriptional regulator [Alteraurantiacibacter sp.]|jgi:CRP/FNR family transcriptional regulator
MNLSCEQCPVRASAACAVLTSEERDALARGGRTRQLKRGEMLFAAGDDNTTCATLIEGALKVSSVDEEGQERILALVHPAGFVGELFAPFSGHDVIALTDSRLCLFSRADLDDAVTRYPALGKALLQRAQEDLHESRNLLELTSRRSAVSRVSGLMVGLAEAASHSPCHPADRFELPMSRGEIAQMLGLTIETVSRAVTSLEKDGIIRRKGARGIDLLDPARLAAMTGD